MADSKITGLTALGAAPATNDLVPIVDVSDTTDSAGGTTKKATVANLFTTPTIASFANATHNHEDAAGGGQIDSDALSGAVSIAKGGTGQTTQTAAFDALAPTTTAGDIIYHNGSDNIRLAKGTAGQVLAINTGETAPEWSSIASLFIAQDIGLEAGTDTLTQVHMTSDSTGTVLFIAYQDSGSTTTANIVRLLKSAGNYYETARTTLTISANEVFGCFVLGSYLYVQCGIGGVGALRRYDVADLANVTSITISGTNDLRAGYAPFTNGTDIYIYSSSGTYRIYTISGTTATAGNTVAYTSCGAPVAAISNGTHMWCSDSVLTGTVNIRKYLLAGGAALSTTSPVIRANTYTGAQTSQWGLFMGSSSLLGIGWTYNIHSNSAVVGEVAHLMGITLP